MLQFTRFSEAEITVDFDVDPGDFANVCVVFSQHGRKLVKDKRDLVVEDNGIGTAWTASFTLSAEETASFSAHEPAFVQIQMVSGSGGVTPSNVEEVDIVDIA